MLNTKTVAYRVWDQTGVVSYGHMSYNEAMEKMKKFEKEAKKVLDETGADHVVYGAKRYAETEYIFNYYMTPMDDARFYRDVWNLDNVLVYALHKRK